MDDRLSSIPEWHHVDDKIFNEEILTQYRPAVLRGFVKKWPVVQHALQSPELVCKYLKTFDNSSVVNAIMTTPEVRGRIFYKDDISGKRRFTLFPPDQVSNLYIGPLEFTPAGAPISMVSPHNPDFKRFPRYKEALAAAQVAELGPGDALFIPPVWWHQVESLEKINILINYWWGGRSISATGRANGPR